MLAVLSVLGSCHLATLHLLARRREINGAEQDRGPCRALHPLPATRSGSKPPARAYPFPKALEFGICASPVMPGTSGGAFCPCHAHFSAVGSLSHLGWDPGAELRPLLSLRAVFLGAEHGQYLSIYSSSEARLDSVPVIFYLD